MRKVFTAFIFIVLNAASASAQVKILFDATKAETSGNADWVIDADQTNLGYSSSTGLPYTGSSGFKSDPQRIPTPAQSGITAGTAETYWTGSLSAWGVDLVNKGYMLETLPYNGSITYGDNTNVQDLANYKVFVIDEPNIKFSAAEKTALLHFVENGGGLFMISDHINSDRNNDGWDSPAIWNDLFTNNGSVTNPFGISVDLKDISGTFHYVVTAPNDSILHGPMGNVTSVVWHNGTTMTIDPTKNTTVQGVVHNTSPASGNSNVVVAYARYGNGKVGMMTDSSPFDDGTGNPNASLYSSYATEASHRNVIMNMTIWLATANPVAVPDVKESVNAVSVYPNPSTGTVYISSSSVIKGAAIDIYDLMGKSILHISSVDLLKDVPATYTLNKGFYFVKVSAEGSVITKTVVVH